MRTPVIAGNWKMNKTSVEAVDLVRSLLPAISGAKDIEVVLIPPFTSLYTVRQEIAGSGIKLGAQDIFWEDKGAFTGEVSGPMLKDAGCSFVIVGHSERREYFREDDGWVNKKLMSALRNGLSPILCIGESLTEREKGDTFRVIERELEKGIEGLGNDNIKKIVIAYEPIWAIGTGRTATPEQANDVHVFIRKWIRDKFSGEIAEGLRIQYGGSVTAENVDGLMAQSDIDGALVGGASLKAESFARIVNFRR